MLLREGIAGHGQRDAGALQGPGGGGHPVADRVLVRHELAHPRQRDRRQRQPAEAVRCMLRRPGADGRPGLDHRVLHRHAIQAGAAHCAGIDDGPRHQHHRGPGRVDAFDCMAGDLRLHRHPGFVPTGRPLRHCGGCHLDAEHGRHRGCARRVRPHHGQRRRHCRDVRPARQRPRGHRSAGRRGQHDQGRDQGLCDRFGRPGLAGTVRRLHAQPGRTSARRSTST